jgi:lipopolysaccharide/colanic/teichoic acid biosynthesis glycosyltransferase
MIAAVRSTTIVHWALWQRGRVQIGGALLFAGVLPPVVAWLLNRPAMAPQILQQTMFGTFAAIAAGLYVLRSMSVFPGMRTNYYVMPVFLVSYGLALAWFFFFRLDYSRGVFLGSFLACVSWTYLVHRLGAGHGVVRFGVVPFGQVADLPEVPRVSWVALAEPRLDHSCQAVVADFRADLPREWEAFLSDSAVSGTAVFHVKQLKETLTGMVEIEHLSENSFGSLIPFMAYLKVRRVADFAAALVAGALLLPFLLVVALLIRIDSPGPALFPQRRIGYRGRPFHVTKFRTMRHVPDAALSDREEAMTKDQDARITRLGRHLRRTRIDELPQLLNILKGEMSWIGPRPEAEILSQWYEDQLPFYRYRHIVPPGITGWAQVSQGHVSELEDVNYKLNYDFYYIKHFSLWLDILILIRTAQTVLTGFGSR